MKILVTGAAGFIGFHLTLALLERDNEVCDSIYIKRCLVKLVDY
jgi:nucleoside-diphosphate-sugar epimerase